MRIAICKSRPSRCKSLSLMRKRSRFWEKRPLKWIGNLAMAGGLIGLFVHYLRFGPKVVEEGKEEFREGKEP